MTNWIEGAKKKHATMQRIIAAADDKIEKLDPGLKDSVRKERIAEIRARADKDLNGVRTQLKEAHDDARKKLPWLSQDVARTKALDALDATQTVALYETLKRTSRPELVARLRQAVVDSDLAKAEAIRLEFTSRPHDLKDGKPDPIAAEFTSLLSRVQDADFATREREQQAVIAVFDLAAHEYLEFVNQRRDPMGRMTHARALKTAEDGFYQRETGAPVSIEKFDASGDLSIKPVDRMTAARALAQAEPTT